MKEYIQSHSVEFMSKYKRISTLINHSASIGRFHEEITVNFLRHFISNRFSIKTGFIFDPVTKEKSNQTDILIIDEHDPNPYFFKEKDFCIARGRSVVLGIEIKSKLSKEDFKKCFNGAQKFRSVCSKGEFYALSFSSNKKVLENLEDWYPLLESSDRQRDYPSLISILDFGSLRMVPETYASPWGHYPLIPCDNTIDPEAGVLSFFLSSIIGTLEVHSKIESNPFQEYSQFETQVLHRCFRSGQKSERGEINLSAQ